MTETVLLHIDGAWVPGGTGETLPNINPATGETIGRVTVADENDIRAAAAAAARAFPAWRATSALDRSAVLRRAAALVREKLADIARAMTVEQGKPLAESRLEATLAAEVIDWFAEEGRRAYGRVVPSRRPEVTQTVVQEPVGPVASFAPWNFPLTQVARKVAAALAAGCTVVIKPPEEAPNCTSALVECFVEAGSPSGVVNLLFGVPARVSETLIPDPAIRKVSFTGSVPVGKQLASLAGQHMKRVTMELGGHAPVIICDDADIDLAAQRLCAAKFANAGQVCISPTRFLVHESVAAKFQAAFLDRVSQIRVGNGLTEGVTMGPLNNERRLAAVAEYVEDARARGATVLTGGHRIGEQGLFYAPTVLTDVPASARALSEEPFGPIALLAPFSDLDGAIAEANRLSFGLAAYAFTDSAATIARLSAEVETGMLGINHTAISYAETPFGGVKDSGYGSDGGGEALLGYLQPKLVTMAVA
ncbi:MAG TPA: NAD-dependent succinate-semialdehyde dehydrogenase [Amycolatopsis sp.]|nr:NAD-dependent succinate-semialdehyde dehydrogenase [Amycolatopsis sp.]